MSHPAYPARSAEHGNVTSPEAVGRFHAFWRGDPMPQFPSWPELSLAPSDDARELSAMLGLAVPTIQDRLRHGHRPWLAIIGNTPVGWGWCATAELHIGELGLTRQVPTGNRYLWDFCTLPEWRGRGIYPRLLRAIVAGERAAKRFWVGHDMPNIASARGIAKAGFGEVGILYRQADGDFVLVPCCSRTRAEAASRLFAVMLGSDLPSAAV